MKQIDPHAVFAEGQTTTAVSKNVVVCVRFAAERGVCETLEGAVGFEAGDAIVTGADGDVWPVRRERFFRKYDPAGTLDDRGSGMYRKKAERVRVHRLDGPSCIKVEGGQLTGSCGDWIVAYPDGTYGIIKHCIFEKTYQISS